MADMADIVARELFEHVERTARGAEWIEMHPADIDALRRCADFAMTATTHDGAVRFRGTRVEPSTEVSPGRPRAGCGEIATGRFEDAPDPVADLAAHLLAGRSVAAFAMAHAADGHDPLPDAWARTRNTSAMLAIAWRVLGYSTAAQCVMVPGVMGAQHDGTLSVDRRYAARACREIRERIRDRLPELTLPDLTRAMRG